MVWDTPVRPYRYRAGLLSSRFLLNPHVLTGMGRLGSEWALLAPTQYLLHLLLYAREVLGMWLDGGQVALPASLASHTRRRPLASTGGGLAQGQPSQSTIPFLPPVYAYSLCA